MVLRRAGAPEAWCAPQATDLPWRDKLAAYRAFVESLRQRCSVEDRALTQAEHMQARSFREMVKKAVFSAGDSKSLLRLCHSDAVCVRLIECWTGALWVILLLQPDNS